jgi:hypothetical protein
VKSLHLAIDPGDDPDEDTEESTDVVGDLYESIWGDDDSEDN